MSELKLYFASDNEPVSLDTSNAVTFSLNITLQNSQAIRLYAKCDVFSQGTNSSVTPTGTSALRYQLALDDDGSPGVYENPGDNLNLGTVQNTKVFFWVKAHAHSDDIEGEDTTVILDLKGVISDFEEPEGDTEPLKIYSTNPWYWEYDGQPVLLLGGSYEDNMFQFPNWYYGHSTPGLSQGLVDWTLEEHLDNLVDCGGNYIRCSLSSRNYGNRFPYLKTSGTPGDNYTQSDTYDLDQWDTEFWNRLDNFLSMCQERNIIAQIEFFDRFDVGTAQALNTYSDIVGNQNPGWEDHPWNPDRNSNYTEATSGLPNEANRPAEGWKHPIWHCVPALSSGEYAPEPIVLTVLQNFVDKVLQHTFEFDNVLYCIQNEFDWPGLTFGAYWMQYINDKASAADKLIYVTDMPNEQDWDGSDQVAVRRSTSYPFYDYSQNNHNTGETHYSNFISARADIANPGTATDIKPITNVKIYGGSTFGGVQEAKERFWRGIFAGISAVRFHRPAYNEYYYGIALNSDARNHIKSARILTEQINIFESEPDNSLLSSRSTNEAFCLTKKGEFYAVYFPSSGSVVLDISDAPGNLSLKWLDVEDKTMGSSTTVSGSSVTLTTPENKHYVALLTTL